MTWTVENMVRIASHGGGLKVSALNVNVEGLVRIASHGKNGGASLIVTDAQSLTPENAVRIANHSPGNVTFEF